MSKEFAKGWLELNRQYLGESEIAAAISHYRNNGNAEIADAIEAEIAGESAPPQESVSKKKKSSEPAQ